MNFVKLNDIYENIKKYKMQSKLLLIFEKKFDNTFNLSKNVYAVIAS